MHPTVQSLFDCILEGMEEEAPAKVQAAMDAGIAPATILNEGMIEAMAEVGKRFEDGDYFLPEMLAAAMTMQAGLALLKPYLGEGAATAAGTVVIGTVKGDLHDIGKNLVAMMLEGAGFEVKDLGTDVAPEKFVEAVKSTHAKIVGLSALLITTMPSMKATIEALQAAGLRDQVKVIIGGAPVNDAYAQQIGADGYSPDASRAVSLAKSLLAA